MNNNGCEWMEYGTSPEKPCDGEVKDRYWDIPEHCDPENGPSPDDVPNAGRFCEKHWDLVEKEFIRYHSMKPCTACGGEDRDQCPCAEGPHGRNV